MGKNTVKHTFHFIFYSSNLQLKMYQMIQYHKKCKHCYKKYNYILFMLHTDILPGSHTKYMFTGVLLTKLNEQLISKGKQISCFLFPYFYGNASVLLILLGVCLYPSRTRKFHLKWTRIWYNSTVYQSEMSEILYML